MRLLRPSIAAVVVAVLASSPVAAESRSRAQIKTQPYMTNGLFIAGHGNLVGQEHHMTVPAESEAVVFQPRAGDRSVHIEVADEVAPWTVVLVQQHVEGARHPNESEFCARERDFALKGDHPVEVRIYSGFCTNHTYGVATTGTVTATFNP